jgi:predicted phosphodiesterase
MSRKPEQWLIIPDSHIPYHDRRAFDLMLAVAQDQKIRNVCILGDFADFYSISSHGRDADMEGRLSREVEEVRLVLDELESICPGDRIYIQGNHEWRLERYINSEAPELFGLIDTRSLLELGDAWKYVPYTPSQLVQIGKSKMWARHEPLTGGTLPAHGSVVKAGCSIIYGHDHKSQEAQVVMANGDTHLGASVGWLGNKNHKAFNYVKGHHQWSLGFGVLTTNVDSRGTFFLNRAIIINYMCIVNGVVYEG